MEALINLYNYFYNLADPRVKNWFMMENPFPTLGIIGVYLLLVLQILPNFMKNRKPMELTKIIRFYNIFQVVACVAIMYRILTSGWIQGEYSIGCSPIDYSNKPNPVKLLGAFYWIYVLKGIELIETIFFALRKKNNQITGLHIYHHGSTFFLAWLGCKFIGGGMASLPPFVNSFIHVLMYTYYYLSSLGPEWQKKLQPWKPRLTMLQMIQFTLLIIHSLTALPSDCKVPRQFLLIYIPNVIVIFKMFYDFYTASYTPSKKQVNGFHTKAKKTT
ncbi:unnamed protein product [Diabrotica balteata]|uniref:Elongation of very long chain fatty acids protein n=1 Tax=Diabrotica balteata TaxID=107213 RepID=A0A9N9XB73_DIABA|nr:unnamed protein product [Diabrotica balteata]